MKQPGSKILNNTINKLVNRLMFLATKMNVIDVKIRIYKSPVTIVHKPFWTCIADKKEPNLEDHMSYTLVGTVEPKPSPVAFSTHNPKYKPSHPKS